MTDNPAPQTKSPKKIFVSYSSPDKEWARWIAARLRAHGHDVTVQADDFLPGRNFVIEMRKALTGTDHVVAVLSPAYEESGFALAEWAEAFADDPTGFDRRLIGVRVAAYRPGPLMRASIYADLCDLSEAEAERALLAAVAPDEHRPGPAPFPGPRGHREDLANRPPVPPNCVWREDEITELQEALTSQRRVAITGMGGIGKTSLASRLLQEVLDSFEVVAWLRGGDDLSLEQVAVHAAVGLGIASDDTNPEDAMLALQAAATPSWLFVIDDCPDASSATDLLPNSSILTTSRNDRGWSPAGFHQLRLRPWTPDEVARFLAAAAPSAVEAAEEIAVRLGGLPLATAQAAAYIDASGLAGSDYLDRLNGYAYEVFSEPLVENYGHTVLSVWAMALDDLRHNDAYAAQILDVCAFLARDEIPLALVRSLASMPEPFATSRHSAVATDRALAALLKQSLCAVESGGLGVHGLIQSVVVSKLGPEAIVEILTAIVTGLSAAAPESVGADSWYEWERLGPHVLAVFGALQSLDVGLAPIRPLATALAEALGERGFLHSAIALRSDILSYILNHRDEFAVDDLAAAAHDLGNSYAAVQMSEAAVQTYRVALQVDDALGQRQSARSLASQVGLIGALTDTGEHDEAARLIEEAARRWERHHSNDLELGVMIYGTWGRLLTRTKMPGDARPHLYTALRLAEESGQQSEVALTLLHLGNADLGEDEVDSAREHYESALDAARQIPNAHFLIASSLQSLANVDLIDGEPARARGRATEALDELAHLPEGEFSVLAAMLHYLRAQVDLGTGGDIESIVNEAGNALDVLCTHLPPEHHYREMVASFLERLAARLDDDQLRAAVESRRHLRPGAD